MRSRDQIQVICDVCGKTFTTIVRYWRKTEKRGGKHCCSLKCRSELQRTGSVVKCGCCGKDIYITRKLLNKKVHYCSSECAHKCINHSHIKTEEQKIKISDAVKNFYKSKEYQSSLKKRKNNCRDNIKKCPICGKEFRVTNCNKKRIYCSRECYRNDKDFQFKKKTSGGLRVGSSRANHGWYKGYWCDSSWELAYVIYNLQHGIKFERNKQGFEYEYNRQRHKFYPDFILEDGTYVEIKGYMGEQNEAKIKFFVNKLLIVDKGIIKKYLNYAIEKYGKNFIELYEK